jgi:[ribosomal protein S5]-alanine N-acetyltransferase
MIVLETERLLFRPHLEEDREDYCRMEMDPVHRYPQRPRTLAEANESFDFWLIPKEMGLLATIYKPEGRYIGMCGLYPCRTDAGGLIQGEARIAFYLAAEYWNRGLATEASLAFLEYGFQVLGLKRIEAGASVKNLASNRVLEKTGMRWVESGGQGENGEPVWHSWELLNPNLAP